ncbi:hypothetical protein JTE90_016469 [Oedothorax gibbosus]|uniref:BTB domain-containing protein n=1 Tax=Oedothorax gibbosus TaxID=931172 RepID=A0AAV6V4Y4_9ARAC|nr:hypothetical protein JTE90_016469 [Oedothorax gibbosus]
MACGLVNRTANFYNNKLFSDVEYHVKDTDGQFKIFHAHKLILAMAGEGFAKIFYDPRLEQPARRKITEFTSDAFDLMLKYIYTDKIRLLNLEDAMNVFQLAACFSVRDLMMECNSFLSQYQVDHDSVFARYDCALKFENRPLIDACRKLVSKDAEAVFRNPFFCMASRSVIEDILKLDRFNLPSELEVIEAILRWCKADCKRRYGSTEYLQVRHSFLPLCRNLRFLTLDIQEFLDFVENHERLLTKHEIEQFTARLLRMNDGSKNDRRLSVPEEFSICLRSRCGNLADSSSAVGSVNGLDISQAYPIVDNSKSNGLYSYMNGDSHSMKANPNRNQSHSPVSNGTNNFNQTLNDTAKKSSPILSYTAQSNRNYPSQSSGPNSFIKTGLKWSQSPPVNGVNNFPQSNNKDCQAYNFPPLSNHPRQINGHPNSTAGKVLAPARSTYSSHTPENSPPNEPLFEVLPKTKQIHTRKVMPQSSAKDVIMSYEFQLHEMQKQISSSCESDIKCHVDIKMLKGTILIHGIELKVKDNSKNPSEEEIDVYLCITKDERNITYPVKVKPDNDILRLPFNDRILVSPENLVDIEVMIDDLKMSRCSVCRAQESRCELNSGLDVTAQIELRSNQSSGNDSFVFLISKILYSVPRY